MAQAFITTQQDAGVLELRWHRPECKNAFHQPLYAELAEALQAARQSSQVRVLVLRGDAAVFSSGNDLREFTHLPAQPEQLPLWQFMLALRDFPKPVVAAVAGAAIGIGATLLLHCDFVVASPQASFAMPFSQLGLCPEFGASLLLPLRVGQATASHWLMSGLVVAAPEAQAKGFIHALAEDPWAAAWQQARAWDAMSQQALCSTKALLKAPWQQPLAQAMELELAAFAKALKGPAFAEAQAAFFAKRPANFSAL